MPEQRAERLPKEFPKDLLPYALPFFLFIAALGAVSGARAVGLTRLGGVSLDPMYWIYPIQTVLCAVVLFLFRKRYDFSNTTVFGVLLGIVAGLLIAAIWVSPQELFHQPRRLDGFDPGVLPGLTPWMLAARFARLVLVVPLVEEVFWRGFLLRYLVREEFTTLPFGSANRFSFWVVVAVFTMVHAPEDWPAAIVTGILLNLLAIRTRSLAACVVAHASANLALGLYICATRQWGFW